MKVNSCIYIIVCYRRKERAGLAHASNGPQNRSFGAVYIFCGYAQIVFEISVARTGNNCNLSDLTGL